jgi:hypothetical protein
MGLANPRAMGTELLKEKTMKIKSNVRAGLPVDPIYRPPGRGGPCSGVVAYA